MDQAQGVFELHGVLQVQAGATKHPRTVVLVPILAALLGAFVYHRYSLLTGLDRVQADAGDSRFIAFLLEHWNNVMHGRADWRSPPMFWPVRGTLAYSDALLFMGLVHAALRTGLGVFAAMNAQLILLSLATFAAAYALFARGFGVSVVGSTVGAYFFAFSWPRFAQLVHVQLQFTVLLPILVLLAVECARDGPTLSRSGFAWRIWSLVALLAALLATTLYYAVFIGLGFTVAGMICLAYGPSRSHLVQTARRHRASLVGAALLAVILIGPIVAFYRPVMRDSHGRPWSELLPFMPRAPNLLWMGRENWVWGWFFGLWPEPIINARWPELRIGAGLVPSCVWAGVASWSAFLLIARRRHLDKRSGAIAIVIVTGLILQLLMIRLPRDTSLWWPVWKLFPGAGAVRAVARLEIVVTLALALAFAWVVDRIITRASSGIARPGRRGLAVLCAAVLVTAGAVEQIGRAPGYSGSRAEALSREVGRALRRDCRATYVVATPDLLSRPDADEAAAERHIWLMYFAYNYTIPLAAALSGVPVVNGLSGWLPQGWRLFDVLAPDAPLWLTEWLARRGVTQESVCVVPVRITPDMVPELPNGMLP